MNTPHTFHIPVMGIGFTVDTPAKVAQYGISSVISLVDDTLIEKMRECYCKELDVKYDPINRDDDDHRAKRITAYLDILDDVVKKRFNAVKASSFEPGSEITKYFELLANSSPLKKKYQDMLEAKGPAVQEKLQEELRIEMLPGSIDVNIMTKLDRVNYDKNGNELSSEYTDALAAFRGFAKSKLNAAIIFSAGINRKLYTYVGKFEDFYANAKGFIKKKIILKVSDYRSSIIQGRFFAKKGLWVSEYRVESGLNCGGHAFASPGILMGPILEEFKKKRDELVSSLHEIYTNALKSMNKPVNEQPHKMHITAQGGIGTFNEDVFIRSNYDVDKTGWATPFLLVPEAVNVDNETLDRLKDSKEDDLYLSDSSPLGVPFNNLKSSLSEEEKRKRIAKGSPGSACFRGHLCSNTEFTEKPICTASKQYQSTKIDQIKTMELPHNTLKERFEKIVAKACICYDLGASPLINNHLVKDGETLFTAVCPGPNLAYFSKVASLKEMADHIYGRVNLLNDKYRPNMFLKELKMYVEHFIKEVKSCTCRPSEKQIENLLEFKNNLMESIEYYFELFPKMREEAQDYRDKALEELRAFKKKLEDFISEYAHIFPQIVIT